MAIFSISQEEVYTKGYGQNVEFITLALNKANVKAGDKAVVSWSKSGPKEYHLVATDVTGVFKLVSQKAFEKYYEQAKVVPVQQAPAPVANATIPFNPGQPVVNANGVNPEGMQQMFNMFMQMMAQQGQQMPAPQPSLPVQPKTVTAPGKGAKFIPTEAQLKVAKQNLGLNRPGVVSAADKARIEAEAVRLFSQNVVF